MIHVCYGMRDESGKYSKFVGTSMFSIFENTNSEVTIHILHDSTLTQENRNRLIFTALQYDQKIEFYNVETCIPELRQRFPIIDHYYATFATFYRFLIPQFLPETIDRVIYFDADVIVDLDINDFWTSDLDSKLIGAIPEVKSGLPIERAMQMFSPCQKGFVKPDEYFNAGVLIFDLYQTRKFFGGGQIFDICLKTLAKYPDFSFADQDALNFIFRGNVKILPGKFNHLVSFAMTYGIESVGNEIYHFNGLTLNMDMRDDLSRLYIKYLSKTKFFNHKSLEHVCRNFSHFIERWQKIAIAQANRKREFFLDPQMVDFISTVFKFTSEDIIVNAQSQNAPMILRNDIAKPDRLIFFVLQEDIYNSIRQQLESLGFKEDQDFFDVTELIFKNPLHCVQNRIIRDM